MRIESGSPMGEIGYWSVLTLFMLGLAGWFFADGAWFYAQKNLEEARKYYAPRPEVDVQSLGDVPDKPDSDALVRRRPQLVREVREALGEPVTSERRQSETIDEYASRYGVLTVVHDGERVLTQPGRGGTPKPVLRWRQWHKSRAEIVGQFYWGAIPFLASVWPLWRLYKALTQRVVLDSEQLTYRSDVIRLEDVISLRDYNPKGWVDLYYRRDGCERMLRLDNQKVARFNEIVDRLCELKSFTNPLKKDDSEDAEAGDADPR